MIVVLWRAGLRINEALSLPETDLDERRGSILVRRGKGDRRREVGMGPWGWSALQPWLGERAKLRVGPLFCVIVGPTRGHTRSASAARVELHRTAVEAGARRRLAPHQLRHAHAVELLHEGIPAAVDPAPARPRPPVDDRHLRARHLFGGDHLDRPRPARADDARQRRPGLVGDLREPTGGLPQPVAIHCARCRRRVTSGWARYRSI